MIGIFDSGIGGLTVVKALREQLPDYQFLYFGDTARTPYGSKSPETLLRYARQNTQWLLDNGAKIIAVACNSASAAATIQLRRDFPGIPIFGVITPAVEGAVKITKNGRIGLVGTRATIASNLYKEYAKKMSKSKAWVFGTACPLLVSLVEEGWLDTGETKRILRKYIHPLRIKNVDTLILGCTHYPLLKPLFQQKMGKQVMLIDPAQELALSVSRFFEGNPVVAKKMPKKKKDEFYVSDLTPHFQKIAEQWLGEKIKLQKVEF